MSGAEIAFFLFAAFAVFSALAMVTARSAVVAAVWLIGTFLAVAATYVLLSATFLGVIQALVYAGAIMVLFVFVIMVIDVDETGRIQHRRRSPAARFTYYGLLLVTVAFLSWVLIGTWTRQVHPYAGVDLSEMPEFGTVDAVGRQLFGPYLFAFEAVSLLLLAAAIGAVVVARSRRDRLADATGVDPATQARMDAGPYPSTEFGKPSSTTHHGA
jgi:NADH-quinone oxidoreductase subunit J